MYQNLFILILAIVTTIGSLGLLAWAGIGIVVGASAPAQRLRGGLGGSLAIVAAICWLGWTGVFAMGTNRFGPWFWPGIVLSLLCIGALVIAIVASVQHWRRGAIAGLWIATVALGIATLLAWLGFTGVWNPDVLGWTFYTGILLTVAAVGLLIWALIATFRIGRYRAISWTLFGVAAIATLFAWMIHNGVFSAGPSDGPVEPTGSPDPVVTLPPESYAAEPIRLTEEQYKAFLSRVSLDFSDRSLVGDYYAQDGKVHNRTSERIAAVALYATANGVPSFEDPVNYPIKEWFPEFDELMDSSLPIERRLELQEAFFDALDQEMVSNVPFGLMVLEGMRDIPYLYTNNADTIDGNLAIINQFFAGTYQQSTDSDLVLSSIPALPREYRGLDYLVLQKTTGVTTEPQVREEWARLIAWASAGLRNYVLQNTGAMIEARESSIQWHHNGAKESSLVRMEKADHQESRDAVILGHSEKDNNNSSLLVSLIGFNRYDSRLLIYNPKQPAPAPETSNPPVETTDPPTQPSTPPSNPPRTNYFDVYVRHVDIDTGAVLQDWFLYQGDVADGGSYTVTASERTGFTAKKIAIEGVGEWWLPAVQANIQGKDARVTIYYDRNSYKLYYECGYHSVGTGAWNVLQPKTYVGAYEYEQAYSVPAPGIDGYKLLSSSPATGNMPAQDYTIYFVYDPVDGQGAKNPYDDPVYQSNAPIGGGTNLPGDGTGNVQPSEPPRKDYPPTASQNPVVQPQPSAPSDQNGGFTDENRPVNSAPPPVDNGLAGETSNGMVTGP